MTNQLMFSNCGAHNFTAHALIELPPLTSRLSNPLSPLQAEREHQYELPQAQCLKSQKESYLIEQVFSPHPFTPSVKAHVKCSPLYTDLRLTSLSVGKRGQPSWTIKEYKRNSGEKGRQLTALDLEVLDSQKQQSTAATVFVF